MKFFFIFNNKIKNVNNIQNIYNLYKFKIKGIKMEENLLIKFLEQNNNKIEKKINF